MFSLNLSLSLSLLPSLYDYWEAGYVLVSKAFGYFVELATRATIFAISMYTFANALSTRDVARGLSRRA
ncbi:hypothetical protein ANAPC5_01340 [Anaplasma phagocytophilum]|nr:hypothetical protein ANAPC5_01340 [Anaplasma phagocytophilum]